MTDPHLGPLYVVVPARPGHYDVSGIQYFLGISAPGVDFQTQVAP